MTTFPDAAAARRRLKQRIAPAWRELGCDHFEFERFADEVLDVAGQLAAEELGGGNYVWRETGPVITQGPGKAIGPARVLALIGGCLRKAINEIRAVVAFDMPCSQCSEELWQERLDYMCAQ